MLLTGEPIDAAEAFRLGGLLRVVARDALRDAALELARKIAAKSPAAVHGYCLGGGIGIAGSADFVIASDDATFGLPEIDRGAMGAATHLSRLVPQHRMRALFYTGEAATAQELASYGSIARVVPRDELREAALEVARKIASKHPVVIRRAKEALNGIDPMDVNRSYRFEQGFTFELNLTDVSDEARQAFVEKRDVED